MTDRSPSSPLPLPDAALDMAGGTVCAYGKCFCTPGYQGVTVESEQQEAPLRTMTRQISGPVAG